MIKHPYEYFTLDKAFDDEKVIGGGIKSPGMMDLDEVAGFDKTHYATQDRHEATTVYLRNSPSVTIFCKYEEFKQAMIDAGMLVVK